MIARPALFILALTGLAACAYVERDATPRAQPQASTVVVPAQPMATTMMPAPAATTVTVR